MGLDWIYSQSSGQLTYVDGNGNTSAVDTGYSGNGPGLNNPAYQSVPDVGPIPQGGWIMDPPINSPNTGPYSIPLRPAPGTDTFFRDLFRIHGDNPARNFTASEGCIILDRPTREKIWLSGDHMLKVVP